MSETIQITGAQFALITLGIIVLNFACFAINAIIGASIGRKWPQIVIGPLAIQEIGAKVFTTMSVLSALYVFYQADHYCGFEVTATAWLIGVLFIFPLPIALGLVFIQSRCYPLEPKPHPDQA